MQHLTKTDWAYIAGILDGEGSISITSSSVYRNGIKISSRTYGLKVIISNTNTNLIKWLQDCIGGKVCVSSRPGKKDSTPVHQNKVCYRWTPSRHKLTKQFLLAVLPYMRLKKEQALLGLKFICLVEENRFCPEEREKLSLQCKALNSGKTVETNTSSISQEMKRESKLAGNCESDPTVTLVS